MKFFSEDITILKLLYKEKTVKPYYLHNVLRLSVAQIVRFIRRYKHLKVINDNDEMIQLTDSGKKWIIENRRDIFCKRKQFWKETNLIKKIK